jgi:hypothetical protein
MDLIEESKVPSKVKSWCSKCLMTFENGVKSQIVANHRSLYDCDRFPCNKPGSTCVRRFRNINSANRHTYCYSSEFVTTWSPKTQIPTETEDLDLGSLALEDPNDFFADAKETSVSSDCWKTDTPTKFFEADDNDSPPYKYADDTTLTDLMDVVAVYLGREFPRAALVRFKNGFKRFGFTSAQVFRIARENKGSWEFLYCDFTSLGPEVTGVAHVLKRVLCEKPGT